MVGSGSGKSLLLIAAVALLAWACTAAIEGTPRHAVAQLREAILAHDPDRALTFIDVDRVVANMIEKQTARAGTTSDEDAIGLLVGRHLAARLRPQLVDFLKQQLRIAITSTEETGYFSSIRKARVWLLDIAVDGDTAVVTPRGEKKAAFRMNRTADGAWKIVEIMPRE